MSRGVTYTTTTRLPLHLLVLIHVSPYLHTSWFVDLLRLSKGIFQVDFRLGMIEDEHLTA